MAQAAGVARMAKDGDDAGQLAASGGSREAAQAGQRGFLVVAFLRLQVQVHLLGKLHEFAVQSGFVVQAHRYRSGHQRYKAERNPTPTYEYARELLQFMAQTPASEPLLQ